MRVVRWLVVPVVLVAVVAGGSVAGAKDAPTAKSLTQKLVKAQLCSNLQLVDAAERVVTCMPGGPSDAPIRVSAYPSHGAMVAALDSHRLEACAVLRGLGAPTANATLSFPVGPTWFVAASPAVNLKQVALVLHGRVKTYRCV